MECHIHIHYHFLLLFLDRTKLKMMTGPILEHTVSCIIVLAAVSGFVTSRRGQTENF